MKVKKKDRISQFELELSCSIQQAWTYGDPEDKRLMRSGLDDTQPVKMYVY